MDDCRDDNEELTIMRRAVENTNEAFVTIDENHRVLFFNKAAERIFGFKRKEVIGHDLTVIMSTGCSRSHRVAVENYLKTRVPKRIGHATEMTATRKDGTTFPAEISFSVSEVGRATYFTGIVRDLTETKKLQEQIIKSERLAALGQLVAEISHEIKNPLMMIGGFAKQLIKQVSDEKAIDKLHIITDEVLRLESLLSELRQYYQPGVYNVQRLDVLELLANVLELVRYECERKNIQLEFSGRGPIYLEGDKDKLKQVFVNLVKNSIEAMENGGRLSVVTKRRESLIEITISDSGKGISESDKDKVLIPFFTTKNKGTGLGLSISKGIVEAHRGGKIDFESREGIGTTFRIRIPMSEERSEE